MYACQCGLKYEISDSAVSEISQIHEPHEAEVEATIVFA